MLAVVRNAETIPHVDELTFVAFTVPVAPAAALAADAVVSWSSNDLTIVGVGIARELRGRGSSRWTDVVAAARTTTARMPALCNVIIDGAPSPSPNPLDALGFARPRFLGGAAFAPGSADRAPWQGFGDAWFVLPRWSYVTWHPAGGNARAMLVLAAEPHELAETARWQGELARLRALLDVPFVAKAQPPVVELQPARADEWRTQVTQITDAIANGESSKIVAARTCKVTLAGRVDVGSLMSALDTRHADCVRVLFRPTDSATLIAATPERLVKLDGRTIQCDALAGTMAVGASPAPATSASRCTGDLASSGRLLASAKDRREHDLVVQAIRVALEAAGASIDSDISEPCVRVLRDVMHLHTPFRARLHESRHVLELVARLHPTPAVGGTPTASAIDWIAEREPVARGWYASPVGWFDFDGNGEFAVAIRSGVIADNRAQLWAGAGIVAGSDPDRELAETDAKFRAMLNALGDGGRAP